jgi:hypothetical protein
MNLPPVPLAQQISSGTARAALEASPRRLPTAMLIDFDRFTRIFCGCGRHTFGPVDAGDFTSERYVPQWYDRTEERHLYSVRAAASSLASYALTADKHDAAGRTASACSSVPCDCPLVVNGEEVEDDCGHDHCRCEADVGHHRILDLTRPFDPAAEEDKYQLPLTGPLWKGDLPYCARLFEAFDGYVVDYLIKRTDGFFVYASTRDCPATPDYRCDTAATCVYWSEDFDAMWNLKMTEKARAALHAAMTRDVA